MINELKKIYKSRKMVSIYTDRDDYDKFSVGYILFIDDEQCLIEHIGTHGEFDGYSVTNIKSIFRIEEDSLYLKKIQKLHDKKSEKYRPCPFELSQPIVKNILDFAHQNRKVVKICISEEALDIIGYIVDIGKEIIKILQISNDGIVDGETFIMAKEIVKISIYDLECIDFELLTNG